MSAFVMELYGLVTVISLEAMRLVYDPFLQARPYALSLGFPNRNWRDSHD